MITNSTFRRAETFLMAADIEADVVCSLIGLALDYGEIALDPEDNSEPGEITLSIAAIADRLGLHDAAALARLSQADGWVREHLGFGLMAYALPADPEIAVAPVISKTFAAVIRGTIMSIIPPSGSYFPDRAAIAEIEMLEKAKAPFLYRVPETADDRSDEIRRAATMIADRARSASVVAIQTDGDSRRSNAGAAILAAILHGADTLVLTENVLDNAEDSSTSWDDESNEKDVSASRERPWQRPSPAFERIAAVLGWIPITIVVPVPRDALLAPRVASKFAGAVGPFLSDREAVRTSLIGKTGGQLAVAAADNLITLWESRPDRARTILAAATRVASSENVETDAVLDIGVSRGATFSAAADTLARSMEPHVWKGTSLVRPAPKAAPFFPELFHSDPDPEILFSAALRKEPGIRILMLSPPGYGKTTAAEHIAKYSIGMDAMNVQATDVFHYRLGHMEKAISNVFRQAREHRCCMIFDEADSIAANRSSASPGSTNIVVSATNQLLVEMDRHSLPIVILSNSGDRLDPAVKRRCDLIFDLQPIPEKLEARAMELIVGLRWPQGSLDLDGLSAVSDYSTARRIVRLQELGPEGALAAVRRARDVRLGRHQNQRRIGF